MLGLGGLQQCQEFALALAREAGEVARRHFDPDIRFEPKSDSSPVTKADLEINRLVIERCKAAYPDAGVLGEEESAPGTSDLLWVCDPIDGTSPYSFGMHASTFCLALVEDGTPVIGIIYDFMNDRLYSAAKGQGAFMNGVTMELPDYLPMRYVNCEWWHSAAVEFHGIHELFFAKSYHLPNYTSTGFMGMQVAQGRIAGEIYAGKSPWDVAALKVIADEVGLRVSSLDGEDQRYDQPVKGLVCAHPDFYDEIFDLLQQARQTRAT